MTDEQQIKLQAFIDGELPEKEAREVAAWVARDAEATALAAELRNTRKALKNFEPALKLPESREFFWSKIEREIERLQPAAESAPRQSVPFFVLFRRMLMPVSALAAVAVAGFIASKQFHGAPPANDVETLLADSGALTYRDQSEGLTVVWLSYPPEKEFTPPASDATIRQP